jgi:hypothetical protein
MKNCKNKIAEKFTINKGKPSSTVSSQGVGMGSKEEEHNGERHKEGSERTLALTLYRKKTKSTPAFLSLSQILGNVLLVARFRRRRCLH